MWKALLAGTMALAIGGSALVHAQERPSDADRPQGPRVSAEDMSALADARIAGLKAALRLTPEQEKNWPAVEQAMRDLAKERADRIMAWREARRDAPPLADPIERLRRRAEAMSERAAGLKKLADASEPLYRSLDESQKRRLALLTRMGPHRMGRGGGMMRRGPADAH